MSIFTDFWKFLNQPADQALQQMYRAKATPAIATMIPDSVTSKLGLAPSTPLKPNAAYFTISAARTYLPYRRIGFQTFYPVIYSTIVVGQRDGKPWGVSVFDGIENKLAELSKNVGNHVAFGEQDLVKVIPFRGDSLAATLAVLAVQSSNYAEPLLTTLREISTVAGIQFSEIATKLAQPIVNGVGKLMAVDNTTQIAYIGNLPLATGLFLVAETDRQTFSWTDYGINSDCFLTKNGNPVDDFPYMIVRITAQRDRPNWRAEVPELRTAFESFSDEVKRAGAAVLDDSSPQRKAVNESLLRFRWLCLQCVDLCEEDAQTIAKQAETLFATFLGRVSGSMTSGTVTAQSNDSKLAGDPNAPVLRELHLLDIQNIHPFP